MSQGPTRGRASTTFTILTSLCFLYFIVGAGIAWLGWIQWSHYLNGAGVVGGLASAMGLLSLARPPATQLDLDGLDADALHRLSRNAAEIKQLEAQRLATEEKIQTLKETQKRIQLVVEKAAYTLFLQEQVRLSRERIAEEVNADPELKRHLGQYTEATARLVALGEEVRSDPDVELINRVLEMATPDRRDDDNDNDLLSLLGLVVVNVLRSYARLFHQIFRI